MIHVDGQWQIDFAIAAPRNGETSRRDCKGAARAFAALIEDGNTPSIPAPGQTMIESHQPWRAPIYLYPGAHMRRL